jgi:hypothetical protein
VGNGAVVIQALINFTEENQDLKRITMMDIAKIVGCSEGSVGRAYNFPEKIKKELRIKILNIGEKLGYQRMDRFKNIKLEFLTGEKTTDGTPEINIEKLKELRKQGKTLLEIKKITGIGLYTLIKEFRRNGSITELTSKEIERKQYVIESARIKNEMITRQSDFRKKLAIIIKKAKNGIPLRLTCKHLGVNPYSAMKYFRKSNAYSILKKQKNNYKQNFISKEYKRESDMTESAESYIKKLGCINIEKEKPLWAASVGKGWSGFRCDFYIRETNTVFELKQRTTSHSNKSLFGQILIYKTLGHNVSVIFPNDITITRSLQHMLDANQVTVHRLS